LNFLACTGAVTDTVLSDQLSEISSDPSPDFVVMTLGGNDIGFSKIAKACLVGLIGAGDCDDKIAEYVLPSIKFVLHPGC
jgi:lysophospholipase L1-like esterase